MLDLTILTSIRTFPSLLQINTKKLARVDTMRQAGLYSRMLSGGKTGPHLLPLARIKKIMKKSDDNVKMITGEAPIMFSKACELFIEELTQRSWMVAMQGKRRTLHKEDVAAAIVATDL